MQTQSNVEIPTTLKAGSILPGNNPRRHFDAAYMDQLADSIRAQGVITPILVRPVEDGYQLVAGERRLRAAITVHGEGYDMPVYIRDISDGEVYSLALNENVIRANMNPAEEAEAAAKILGECSNDRAEACRRLGWKPEMLDKRLALMNCSQKVRDALIDRKITLGHAELLAAATRDKQDVVLDKLLASPALVPVAEFKATLDFHSKELQSAIFDKSECAGCQHNSSNQSSLFAEAITDGKCTNGSCFEAKTIAELEVRKVALAEEYPTVKIVQPGENFTVIKIVADGDVGVGIEQAKACRGCQNFGAAISNVPGKVGKVYADHCFDPVCNGKKVAERIKAEKQTKQAEAQAAAAAPKGATPAKAASKPKAVVATSVQDSQRVKEYRGKIWRSAFRKELFSSETNSLTVLLAICMTRNARCIDSGKLNQAFQKLAGGSESLDIAVMAKQIAEASEDTRKTMLQALAPSVEKELEERHIVGILQFLGTDLARYWELNGEYLDLLTKSEIKVMSEEIGLLQHMGEKEFNSLMGKKKDEIIKALLQVEGFVYQGKIPKAMQFTQA